MTRYLPMSFVVAIVISAAAAPSQAQGTLERIQVRGASLEGNLSGDDPSRSVAVYLPPSYKAQTTRRYPVVYFCTATARPPRPTSSCSGCPRRSTKPSPPGHGR